MKEQFGDAAPHHDRGERIRPADIEDLIQREDMVVTVTHGGYVKRVPLSTYRAQRRGGKGRAGMATRGGGLRHRRSTWSTPTRRCCSSRRRGMVYKLKVYAAAGHADRRAARRWSTCCRWPTGETITTCCRCPRTSELGAADVMFATASRQRAAQLG